MTARPARNVIWVCLLLLFGAAGCLPSERLAPGRMDELWQTDESLWEQARPEPPGQGAAYRYELVYEPSAAWAIIELHQTILRLPEIRDVARFPISQQQALGAAQLLRDLAQEVRQLSRALQAVQPGDERAARRWAAATAQVLLRVHRVLAAVDPDPSRRARAVQIDPEIAWVILPALQLLAASLGGEVGDVTQVELAARLRQVEEVLTRIVLTTALRMIARPAGPELVADVLRVQRTQDEQDAAENIARLLLWQRHVTPPQFTPLPQMTRDAAAAAKELADGMEYVAALAPQWSNVNYLALEMRRHDQQRLLAFEFDIKPGRTVELRDLDLFAPRVVFTGHGRVVVQRTRVPESHEEKVAILFQSDDEGGILLHFDTVIYSLVRLFALPLCDAALREIRYVSRTEGRAEVRLYEVLFEQPDGSGRQLTQVRTGSTPRLRPRPPLPPLLLGRDRSVQFRFFNEQRVWHYRRETFERPELWQPIGGRAVEQ